MNLRQYGQISFKIIFGRFKPKKDFYIKAKSIKGIRWLSVVSKMKDMKFLEMYDKKIS